MSCEKQYYFPTKRNTITCSPNLRTENRQEKHTLECFDEGVDEDDKAFGGDPESFRDFLSFIGGESGPFSILGGELAS